MFVGCSEIGISVIVKHVRHVTIRDFCLPGGAGGGGGGGGLLKLVSAIFYQVFIFNRMIALQKL